MTFPKLRRTTQKPARSPIIDWERAEQVYRDGKVSIREIARRRCAISCDNFFCPSVSVVMRIVALLAARRCRCARAMLLLLISAPGSNRHTCRGDR